MPDWRELVKRNLGGMQLAENDAMEVVEELAAHLEEAYQTFLNRGFTEQAAIQKASLEVSDWRDLRTKIESSREKEPHMNTRVRQFWLPAFLTLFLSQVALMLIQTVGPRIYISPAASHPRLLPTNTVFVAWLLTLPFIGGLGAYLSARAGGTTKSMFSAVTFPVFPFLAFIVIGLPIAMAFDDHVARGLTLPLFLVGFSAWVVFPAMALVAGGWSLRYVVRRLNGSRVAGN
jgi:hypothetical protein